MLPFPSPEDIPSPESKPASLACVSRVGRGFFTTVPPGRPIKEDAKETSMAVHWLRLQTSSARGVSSVLGKETKIPYASGSKIK